MVKTEPCVAGIMQKAFRGTKACSHRAEMIVKLGLQFPDRNRLRRQHDEGERRLLHSPRRDGRSTPARQAMGGTGGGFELPVSLPLGFASPRRRFQQAGCSIGSASRAKHDQIRRGQLAGCRGRMEIPLAAQSRRQCHPKISRFTSNGICGSPSWTASPPLGIAG